MKVYIVWLRNELAYVCLTEEKAKEKVSLLEIDYQRKGVAWYTEEKAQ